MLREQQGAPLPLPRLPVLIPGAEGLQTEGSGTLVMWLNCFSLPASTGFLLLSTCVSRGEHMGHGDLMFHGLLGCQNVLHYYL